MALIQLDHVSKFYSQGKNAAKGLDDVSLSFQRGEFVAITGESGSGKTTLLNVITLMDDYDEGDILFEGKSTADFSEDDLLSFRRDYVSFVFQEYNLIPNLSARENLVISLVNKGYKRKEAMKRAESSLKECGLEKRMREKVVRLSGGERQRVVIARALALDSPIIAFDEPTGNLDSKTGKEIIDLIAKIKENRLILYVTHDYESVEKLCNRHIVLENGRLLSDTRLGERNVSDTTKETKERGKKNSFSALLLSCLSLIFSAPKKLALMCLSVLLLTCATIGITLAGTYTADTFETGLTAIYNRYHPKAFEKGTPNMLYLLGKEDSPLPEEKPQGALAYQSVSYLPYVDFFLRPGLQEVGDNLHSVGRHKVSLSVGVPEKSWLSYGDRKDEEGFYVLFSDDNISLDYQKEAISFLKDYLGKESRFDPSYYPILSLASDMTLEGIPEYEKELSDYVDSLPLLGIGHGDIGDNAVMVFFPLVTAERISKEVEKSFKAMLISNVMGSGLDLTLPMDIHTETAFQATYLGREFSLSLSGYGVSSTVGKMSPFLALSDSWAGKEEEIMVSFNGISMSLKEILFLFADLLDMESLFRTPGDEKNVSGSIYWSTIPEDTIQIRIPAETQTPFLALLLVRSHALETVYYPNAEACKNGYQELQKEGYLAYPSDYRYWVGEEPTSMDYVQYCFSAITITFLVFVLLFVFFFVTYPVLKAILKRYNPDFGVLTTLGYPRRSLFLFRSVIVLLPMTLTYIVLSIIVCLYLNAVLPGFIRPALFVAGFFLLLLFGALLLLRFYGKEKKRTLNSILKDNGGQR